VKAASRGVTHAEALFFVQLLDLPLKLARLTTSSECGEHELLGSLAPAPPLHEVEAARDLARGHRPDMIRRIVGCNESVDGFR